MSITEWEDLTPEEFGVIVREYNKRQASHQEHQYKLMRLHACLLLQVHTSKKIAPTDLFRLPSDDIGASHEEQRSPSKEEARERFDSLMKRIRK